MIDICFILYLKSKVQNNDGYKGEKWKRGEMTSICDIAIMLTVIEPYTNNLHKGNLALFLAIKKKTLFGLQVVAYIRVPSDRWIHVCYVEKGKDCISKNVALFLYLHVLF